MADKQKNIPEFEIKPAELVYTSAKIKKVMREILRTDFRRASGS